MKKTYLTTILLALISTFILGACAAPAPALTQAPAETPTAVLAPAPILTTAPALTPGPALTTAPAGITPDSRVSDLIQAGKLRVGVAVVNAPLWATKDKATGVLQGLTVDLAHALATRLGVEFVPVEYPNVPAVLDGLKTSAWDVAFLGIDPSRATVVDFSSAYLLSDSTFLVPPGSSIRTIADVDKPGVRIAVTRDSVEEITLRRTYKQAELKPIANFGAGLDLLRTGSVEALAGPLASLLVQQALMPGSVVLEGSFLSVSLAMIVPKGQTGRLAYLNEFIEEAKTSGLVQQAIERHALRGVRVAPKEK